MRPRSLTERHGEAVSDEGIPVGVGVGGAAAAGLDNRGYGGEGDADGEQERRRIYRLRFRGTPSIYFLIIIFHISFWHIDQR